MSKKSFEEVKNNKNFCPVPFLLYYTRTLGKPKLCPMALKKHDLYINGTAQAVGVDNFMDHWNSKEMQEIRQNMIQDLPVEDCLVCREQEAAGTTTMKSKYREKHSEDVRGTVNDAIVNDGKISSPQHWDLSIGNQCNLACRICSPTNSSKLDQEIRQNQNEISTLTSGLLESWGRDKKSYVNDKHYFRDIILKNAGGITELKIQGGEPTVTPVVWETLSELAKRGFGKRIKLKIFTNMQSFERHHLEVLKQFKDGIVFCSIDAYGKENDFLRYPSDFGKIENNLKLLKEITPLWAVSLLSAISHYNCLSYPSLLDWAERFYPEFLPYGEISVHDVAVPTHLQPALLPREERLKWIDSLEEKRNSYWIYNQSPNKNTNRSALDSYIKILQSPDVGTDSLRARSAQAIRDFDKMRGQNTLDIFPHLKSFMDL